MHQKNNLTGLTVVALLHVALLAAFLHGSKLTVFRVKEAVIDLTPTTPEPPPKVLPPDVPLPKLAPPDIFVPQVETPVLPSAPPPVTARPLTDQQPAQPTPTGIAEPGAKTVVKAAPQLVAAVVDAKACAKPDYPKSALRNGDTGTVTLSLLIGTDGRVADSKVEKSSGFRELDRAAQVGLGLCRFKPGTVDGVPQQSWTKMQYVWSLDE
ncbi:energy transducer TonB [Duganella sp. BJB488]|uniref:energy transducer TonB n=1 Tax=unclassified Duganella TaxID=2636909 RepID=UPI000E34AA73|nr:MULTISPECIES: energy transducer TonB [unclassified Duganella]RFP11598.1 energy transducer TonB [Duganella sp. BJB489]RFP15688.1 energy transducer TonB [Duganella sp. BJB488]RFP30635.1 energy transducer TonB [Duganella sp. BJB480]